MNSYLDAVRQRVVVFDGATGTNLQLRQLGPDDRAALLLFYALDLPLAEVAAALRVSPAAAKARIHRAAGRLRTMLGEEVPR